MKQVESAEAIASAGNVPSRNHLESAAIDGLCEYDDYKVHEVFHGFS